MKQILGLSEAAHQFVPLLSGLCVATVSVFLPIKGMAATLAVSDGVGLRIEKLLQDGRNGEAEKELRQAQSAVAERTHLKFLTCVLQVQQTSHKKAVGCFQQLVQEYPNLPEAYNNIGVLYAGMGMPMEARKWLERGLKQQQAYATLYQNLQNLQADMNRNAYAAALQLDISKSNVQTKLSLLGRMTSVPEMTQAAEQPVHAAISQMRPAAPVGAAVKSAVVAEPGVQKTAVVEKMAVAKPSPETSPNLAHDSLLESNVRDAIQVWAQAWRVKDLTTYFKAYSPNFVPEDNLSQRAWENQRRQRIASKKEIRLELSQFRIGPGGVSSTAIATFTQSYESGTVVAVSRKTLELIEDKGQWLITRESASPIRP